MIDKFVEKLASSAAFAYMPHLEQMAQARAAELAQMKAKVRESPAEVEEWFDREIDKLGRIGDVKKDAVDRLRNATAGI